MKRHMLTNEQYQILNRDLTAIMCSLGEIANLLNACYGDQDPRVARAEESQASLQRLLWAFERQAQNVTVGNACGSERVRHILQNKCKFTPAV